MRDARLHADARPTAHTLRTREMEEALARQQQLGDQPEGDGADEGDIPADGHGGGEAGDSFDDGAGTH